jgi:hypothetical protein
MNLLVSTPGTRLGSLGALGMALTWAAVTFGSALTPAPVSAQTPSKAYYTAELAQPASDSRAIAGELVWACNGTSCVADKGTSRPLRICREVNRKFGQVAAFTTKGEALPAEELAKCNG